MTAQKSSLNECACDLHRSSGRKPALIVILAPDSWILNAAVLRLIKPNQAFPSLIKAKNKNPFFFSLPLLASVEEEPNVVKSTLRKAKVPIFRKKRLFKSVFHLPARRNLGAKVGRLRSPLVGYGRLQTAPGGTHGNLPAARNFGFWRGLSEGACRQRPVTGRKRRQNSKGPLLSSKL
jgi:hypothetical protein